MYCLKAEPKKVLRSDLLREGSFPIQKINEQVNCSCSRYTPRPGEMLQEVDGLSSSLVLESCVMVIEESPFFPAFLPYCVGATHRRIR